MAAPGESGQDPVLSRSIAFSYKLFNRTTGEYAGPNLVLSPVSTATVLAMVMNGAAGTTREAIARVLELENIPVDDINRAFAWLWSRIMESGSGDAITIEAVNRLEVDAQFTLHPAFLEVIGAIYRAEVDYPVGTGAIRLINRIHFNGKWTLPFRSKSTRQQPFHLPDGTRKGCWMMQSLPEEWAYLQQERFQMVRLPYGDGQISMVIILPSEESTLEEIAPEIFTPEGWSNCISGLTTCQGIISLPRMKTSFTVDLTDVLQRSGLAVAFDIALADFTALCPEPVYIERVSQQVWLEVDEAGTDAMAESMIQVVLGSFEPGSPFQVVVNRPFFFVLQDERLNLPLFTGRITDPVPDQTERLQQDADEPVYEMLNLLITYMEQGISFLPAMGKIYEERDTPLAVEIGRMLREIQLGKPLTEALQGLSQRYQHPKLTRLIEGLLQVNPGDDELLHVVRTHRQCINGQPSE